MIKLMADLSSCPLAKSSHLILEERIVDFLMESNLKLQLQILLHLLLLLSILNLSLLNLQLLNLLLPNQQLLSLQL